MALQFTLNPTRTISLSARDNSASLRISGNATARFASVVALDWASLVNVPVELTNIGNLATTGLITRTDSDGTIATRTLTAPAAGFTITNPAGIAGDPTFVLANDLAALEAMASTGLVARTASETYAQRTLTAPAAGITVSNGDGVSGDPTLALANDLAAYEGLSTTGLVARTGDGTATTRALTAPAAGITVSNGDGVSGNPTLALANDLAAYEGLASNGLVARTGDGNAAARTLTAPAAGITVSNGDGVSGNPTLALANDLAALEALSGTDTIYYRSAADTWTAVTIGTNLTFSGGTLAATGGVAGPGSSTDNAVVRFDGAGGATLQNSSFIVDDSGHVTSFGGNIKFPATQVASADANTLDDYEEGTFTPTITFTTPGDLSVTYAIQHGKYTKIGRKVFITLGVATSAFTHSTASGSVQLPGLPFTSNNTSNDINMGSTQWAGITKASYTDVILRNTPNTAYIDVVACGSGVSAAAIAAADMPSGGAVNFRTTLSYDV